MSFFKNYNLYPSFNKGHKKFRQNYEKLPTISRKKVTQKYISPTPHAKALKTYITKRENSSLKPPPSLTVLLHHNLISQKRPQKHYFSLTHASLFKVIVTGEMTPADFAIQVLGLTVKKGTPSIEYEFPEVLVKKTKAQFSLQVSRGGKVVVTAPLHLLAPLSDLARGAIKEHTLNTRIRVGTRLAAKHIAAIISAYASYKKALSFGLPSFFAGTLAASLYVAANRAIAASEKADLRSWFSLPHSISTTSLPLPPGTYHLSMEKEEGQEKTHSFLKEIHIKKGQSQLISTRVF